MGNAKTLNPIDFQAEAEAMREELIARRRDFHQQPELAFEEVRSAKIIAEELNQLGMEVQTGVGKTGVVGILEGTAEGPTVLYRADMDALPIQEENDVSYASVSPGVMHACGHDGHMAIALGVAKLMAGHRERIAGRIKFVFQPGEEGAGGALAMIKDGVLKSPDPEIALGMHLWNSSPLGTIGIADGAIMSGSSTFNIIVKGRGGHGGMPHTTIDPVVSTGQLITALHTIVGRKMDAMAGAVVLSVTGLKTSTMKHNIIPETVEIMGTFRTLHPDASQMMENHIQTIAKSICEAAGCQADVAIHHLTIPTVNNPEVVQRMRQVFSNMVDEEMTDTNARTMASEDFSHMLDKVPGMFLFLGSANRDKGLDYGHHHPRFDFDEGALPLGVALMSAAIADYVLPEQAE